MPLQNRLIIYNPQAGMYGKHVWSFIIRKKDHDKLFYILELSKSHSNIVQFYTDGLASSFPLFPYIKNIFLKKLLSYVEFFLWCLLNRVPLKSIKITQPSDDNVLFTMANKSSVLTDNTYSKSFLKDFRGKKIIHMSHYFEKTKKVSKAAKECQIRYAMAEAPLNVISNYFNTYYDFIEGFLSVPFALRKKYKVIKQFDDRLDKCVAIGSTHSMARSADNEDFQKFFRQDSWHWMRRKIYDEKQSLKNIIDCKISDYHRDEGVKERKTKFGKILNLMFSGRQRSYMSFDIVELYNNYKLVVSPEEDTGAPSINFVECMACGCLYIGADIETYASFGLEEGIHYVSYEKNNLSSLVNSVQFCLDNPDEARKIAQCGHTFVLKNFNAETVKQTFLNSVFNNGQI